MPVLYSTALKRATKMTTEERSLSGPTQEPVDVLARRDTLIPRSGP